MTAAPAMLQWMTCLADATRARVLRLLERHELTVAELCAVVQLPQSTVSRHLKLLADDGWIDSRREATSRLYRIAVDLEPAARRLWALLKEQTADLPAGDQDERRLEGVLAERQTRSQAFFSSAAGQWDKLRTELFGSRFDLLALPALLDPTWTVGDLGCGTGQMAEVLAPFVKQVIAVDSSAAMLRAAKKRLKSFANVDVRQGELSAIPIDDDSLDAAIVLLVLHHLSEPAGAIAQCARALRPGGKLLIVDMLRHDRRDYQQQMGHVWLGFDAAQIEDWLDEAGFDKVRITGLPVDPAARGPALFAAVARKVDRDNP